MLRLQCRSLHSGVGSSVAQVVFDIACALLLLAELNAEVGAEDQQVRFLAKSCSHWERRQRMVAPMTLAPRLGPRWMAARLAAAAFALACSATDAPGVAPTTSGGSEASGSAVGGAGGLGAVGTTGGGS